MESLRQMLGNMRRYAIWWKVPFAFSGVCLGVVLVLQFLLVINDPAEGVREAARQWRIFAPVLAVTAIAAVALFFLAWLRLERRVRKLRK